MLVSSVTLFFIFHGGSGETGLLCIMVLSVLEHALLTRLALNLEILLPVPSNGWNF